MKIFIGSSKESEDIMTDIGSILENMHEDPVCWNEAFIAGEDTFESLVEISKSVDAAIFIFKADDKTWFRNKEINTVRDNVLLEYGLFTGSLGRDKVIFVCSGNPDIASDLKGITNLNFDNCKNTLKKEIKKWLNKIKNQKKSNCNEYREEECRKKFQNIFTKEDMIKKYEEFLESAREAYILVNDIDSFFEEEGKGQLEKMIQLKHNCKVMCCKSTFIDSYNDKSEEFKNKFNNWVNKIDLRFFEEDKMKNIINIKGQFIYKYGEKIIKSLIVQKDKHHNDLFKLMEFDNDYLNDMLFQEVKKSFEESIEYEKIKDQLNN